MELVKAAQGRANIEIWVDSDNIEWGVSYLSSFACEAQIFHGTKELGQSFFEKSIKRLAGQKLVFHIVNSAYGFALIPLITTLQNTAYFISAFGDAVLPDGRKSSALRSLDPQYRHRAKRIFMDSAFYRDTLAREKIADINKMVVLAHPPAITRSWDRLKPAGRLLWASRISDEKRLEDVLGIAIAFPQLTISVFGGIDKACCSQRGLAFYQALHFIKNVEIKGEYKKFDDIRLSDYDALIYTSERDGLPNVLIEAGAAGIPIISTIVGGIGELLDEKNSFSKPNATLTDYIGLISTLYINFPTAKEKAKILKNKIISRSDSYSLNAALDIILGESVDTTNSLTKTIES